MERKTLFVNDAEFKFASSDAPGQFVGLAACYGNVDKGRDMIMPEAFKGGLDNNGEPLLLYFQHDYMMPVGKILEAAEAKNGLRIKGELTPGHSLASDVRSGMLHGTLSGLSVGINIPKNGAEVGADGIRKIHKALLREVSITNMPMNPKARIAVDSVKSALEAMNTLADFEDFLRDVGNFSHTASKAAISRMKELIAREQEKPDAFKRALELFSNFQFGGDNESR